MARVAGVDLPKNKRVEVALTYIYGIGRSRSNLILKETGVDKDKRVKDLAEDEIARIRSYIDSNFKVEGELKQEVAQNIKRLIEISCYRGVRHVRGLPVRGQRTQTNARTRKGPRRLVGAKKGKK